MVECNEVQLYNNKIWKVKSQIKYRNQNIIYFLKCKICYKKNNQKLKQCENLEMLY